MVSLLLDFFRVNTRHGKPMYISNSSYLPAVQQAYGNNTKATQNVPNQNIRDNAQYTDRVSISSQAKNIASMEARAVTLDFPPLSLDPQVHAENAKARISEILTSMGLSTDTPINITSDSQGNIDFEVNHPDREKIRKVLSEDKELRNSIIGGHNAATLQRIAKAHQMAFNNIPEGDDAAITSAFNWLQSFIKNTQAMPYVLRYQGESVVASFTDGKGHMVDYMNNFSVPKFT